MKVPFLYRIASNETDLCSVQRRNTGATTVSTAPRIPCTGRTFPPHSQIQTARSVHLFISRFVCYDRHPHRSGLQGQFISLFLALFATTGGCQLWGSRVRSRCFCHTHRSRLQGQFISLFLVLFATTGLDSSEDPVYGADVSATLTDPNCKVSSRVFLIRIRINLSCRIRIQV